jgi:GTP diphosphokinase / guanosine-3',5'-bis(diphosphate) 3'-diphosphatase
MFTLFIAALRFASEKHMTQRKKGCDNVPYIHHLIKVTDILYTVGKESGDELLCAALLHDIIEDTNTTIAELTDKFGSNTAALVAELTDNMNLNYEDRKRQQINKAGLLSTDAKKIKIADKIANIDDMLTLPLIWSNRRKRQYIIWSQQVIDNCRGVNPALEQAFDEIVQRALDEISDDPNS